MLTLAGVEVPDAADLAATEDSCDVAFREVVEADGLADVPEHAKRTTARRHRKQPQSRHAVEVS